MSIMILRQNAPDPTQAVAPPNKSGATGLASEPHEAFSVPQAELLPLLDAADVKLDATELRASLGQLMSAKKAELIEVLAMRVISGQRMKSQSGDLLSYPTDVYPPRISAFAKPGAAPAVPQANPPPAA